jgi:uncharacterized circularly permuted ATP-grasp superfamily protein/uncharacterized alpha-E superfamily protein
VTDTRTPAEVGDGGLVHAYAARRGSSRFGPSRWDEMVGFHGRVRRGWRELGAMAETLGPAGLAQVAADARRLLAEDGVTYRPLGGTDEQTWGLDPLPVFVDESEWGVLEQALAQRALLLDRLLADLYGPRETIRAGILPTEIVHAHPGFLRAWDQIPALGARQLFLCGTDLARGADGAWCVIADRVQAPSGAGYAMANRRVTSRVLPVLHRQAEIHRLGPFFHAMRLGLEQVAPPTAEAARVVLLTPGTQSETAFEQAFLSSLLGYPLVRGSDLVVSDGRVWQRALGRLEPVDVILRRVDSWFCDPLDLRPDSQLGVPGLIEAARLGTVTVVNALGSGVLENPGLLPFLPAVAKLLLGEPLRLKSVPTWWCGDPDSRRHVLAHLDELVLKPIARGIGRTLLDGAALSAADRDDLRLRIEAEPYAWVGQEALPCSTAPTVVEGGLAPRNLVWRTFAVAAGAGYQVMTGGVAEVRTPEERLTQRHGTALAAAMGQGHDVATAVTTRQVSPTSKDVWIRNTRGAPVVEPWVREATPSQMHPLTVSPRVTEDMFWLGRYAERAEDTARLLRAVTDRWSDFQSSPEPAGAEALTVLLEALTVVTATWPGFTGVEAGGRVRAPQGELASLLLDEHREGTLAYAVRRLTEVAGDVREQLSTDTWMVLGSVERALHSLGASVYGGAVWSGPGLDTSTALASVVEGMLSLAGLTAESLVRDTGWRFLDLGRRLERAQHVSALLAATLGTERDPETESLVVESVLIAGESIITYRRRYQARAGISTLLDLLLTDRENPRAVAYQLDRLGESLDRIPGDGERLAAVRGSLIEVRARLRAVDTAELARPDASGARVERRRLLADLSTGLLGMATDVEKNFFVHAAPLRPMMPSTAGEPW